MGALSPTHWLIAIGVLVLLFGAKKLPDAARSVGQSLRIIKAETGELRGKDKDAPAPAAPTAAAPPALPPVQAQATAPIVTPATEPAPKPAA